jgi:hypothetical protein
MALPMTFRRRKMLREKGDIPDVYQYASCSQGLRTQLLMKLDRLSQIRYPNFDGHQLYSSVLPALRFDKKVFTLADRGYVEYSADKVEFCSWFMAENDLDHLLSGLELFLNSSIIREIWVEREKVLRSHAVEEINAAMLEDGFGFQFENGMIIEIGSEFIHKEVVVPVLGLLSNPKYATVNEEFRKAHDEFRRQDYEDSIHDCCNAFESMGKIIAKEKGWSEVTEKATAKDIVKALFAHQFIPAYMEQEFTGLRTILESGINTVRNKAGGHGQGPTPRVIDKQVAEFQINQTAAVLKLLAEYNA